MFVNEQAIFSSDIRKLYALHQQQRNVVEERREFQKKHSNL